MLKREGLTHKNININERRSYQIGTRIRNKEIDLRVAATKAVATIFTSTESVYRHQLSSVVYKANHEKDDQLKKLTKIAFKLHENNCSYNFNIKNDWNKIRNDMIFNYKGLNQDALNAIIKN